MQLSVQQTQELLRIIDRNQLAVIGSELGAEFLTDYDKEVLRQYGVDPEALYAPELSSINTSFHFGMLAEALGSFEAGNLTYDQVRQYVKEGRYIPISERQKAALASIKMQTFASVKSLGGNIFTDVNNIITDKTRAGQQELLAKELKEGIDKAKTVKPYAVLTCLSLWLLID